MGNKNRKKKSLLRRKRFRKGSKRLLSNFGISYIFSSVQEHYKENVEPELFLLLLPKLMLVKYSIRIPLETLSIIPICGLVPCL